MVNKKGKDLSIDINFIVGLSVCSFNANLFCLKSERHETLHVRPLGTQEGSSWNGFFNFDLEV